MNDLNPSLSLSDEGVDTILRSLQSVRDRALSKLLTILIAITDLHDFLHQRAAHAPLRSTLKYLG